MRDAPDPVSTPVEAPPAPANPQRSPAEALQAIAAAPWAHDFFAALRRIDAANAGKPLLGTARRPADEPVRLGQAPDLSFAPASLHVVAPGNAHRPARLDVRFFGLFGPNGALPLHMTEYARERQLHHGDATFARFADLFHHRLLLLFYRAWAQAQPVVSLDRPGGDRFADQIGALIGIGSTALRQRDAAPDHAKLHFAGLLSRQVRNADGLANLVSGFLRRPVRVEQFSGQWMALQPSERSRIGLLIGGRRNQTARLGQGAALGSLVWDRQHHIRLHAGPLDLAAFETLLPGGTALPAVASLVRQYIGDEFGWDLKLRLQPEAVRPTRPGRHGRLGWTTWLGTAADRPRRAATELLLHPTSALRAVRRRPAGAAPISTPHH